MTHRLVFSLLAVVMQLPSLASADESVSASFDRQVAPLLAQRCLECHNASTKKGGLDLSQAATAMAGGESGLVLKPDEPDESLLWERVAADDMPRNCLLARRFIERRLLDETLVIWGGEFGRTPMTEGVDGRDHNPYGYTMWMVGGGVKPGITYGRTDDYGFQAVENPVHVHDLHATILHLLGLDHERLTYRYAGRDFRLTDVEGKVVKELLA